MRASWLSGTDLQSQSGLGVEPLRQDSLQARGIAGELEFAAPQQTDPADLARPFFMEFASSSGCIAYLFRLTGANLGQSA
jgi:hypothetical protein